MPISKTGMQDKITHVVVPQTVAKNLEAQNFLEFLCML